MSPFPSLFNYGSVPDTQSPDGDPCDALVLGDRLQRGVRTRGTVLGVVDFLDHDLPDPKLIVGSSLGRRDRMLIEVFFRVYAPAKTFLDPGPGRTRFRGIRVP